MRFYVYLLLREDGSPFYVGKGIGARMYDHVREARRHAGINPHKERIIRKMLTGGKTPGYKIDSRHSNEEDAHAREVALIAAIGRHNLGIGPLTNLTAGGDGIVGNVLSKEQKAAISAFQKARFEDPELKEWARRNLERQRLDPRFFEAVRRHLASESMQTKRRAGHAAKMADPDYQTQVAEATRQQWLNPEFRAIHTERNRQMGRDPLNLAINSAAARERWANGVYGRVLKGVMVDGQPYRSMSEAAQAIGLTIGALSARFRRYVKKGVFPDGYTYLPEDFPWHLLKKARKAA